MQPADAQVMDAFQSQNAGQRDTLIVEFYMESVQDERASNGWEEECFDRVTGQRLPNIKHPGAGRPIYTEQEFIDIRIPGNIKEIRRRPVRASDRAKWPAQYAAFKAQQAQPTQGTPLSALPFFSKSQVLEFAACNVKTAENIRDMADVDGQKFMGFAQLKKRVADWLDAAAGNVSTESLRGELAQRDEQNKALADRLAELEAKFSQPKPQRKKYTRKPKEEPAPTPE